MKFPLALHCHAGGFTVLSGEIKSNYDSLQSTVAERRNALPAARLQSKSVKRLSAFAKWGGTKDLWLQQT
jgi:hypothetical protein